MQGGIGPLVVPAERLAVTDTCGAGDRFAAAAAAVLRQGALTSEAVTAATAAASSYLAAGGAGWYSSPTRTAAVTWRPCRPEGGRYRKGGRCPGRPAARPGRLGAGPPDPGGRRDRGRDGRLLRPAARRSRQPAAGGPVARRLPDRLPQLGRVGTQAEGRRAPAEPRGRPGRRAGCPGMRGRHHRLQRGHPLRGAGADTAGYLGQGRRLRWPGPARSRATGKLGRGGRHRPLSERPVDHAAARGGAQVDGADRA